MDTVRASKMASELMGQKVGGWVLSEFIGAGKSALVFRSHGDAGPVAVKIFDPELVERFGKPAQEIRIQRELELRGKQHDNLVQIFDGGYCGARNLFYMVMGYVDAPNLASVLRDVPREKIAKLVSQIAAAAQFLERFGLAHRDIKPENIAVTPDFEKAVLLDLGVLKPVGIGNLTDVEGKSFVGTLRYSPPEFLFREEDNTPDGWRAVTFYQLGGVLHDMIMRRPLFEEFSEPYTRLVRAVADQIPKIEADNVAPELALLAANCLLKEPSLRIKLVSWTNFSAETTVRSDVVEAKERIRRRQAISQVARPGSDTDQQQRAFAIRRKLEHMRQSIQALIREECVGSELLPPIEVNELNGVSPNELRSVFVFRPSPQHGLSYFLRIVVAIGLVDERGDVIRVQTAAAVADTDVPVTPPFEELRTIFDGAYQDAVIRKALQNVLYPSLDSALALSSAGLPNAEPLGVRWIRLDGTQRGGNE